MKSTLCSLVLFGLLLGVAAEAYCSDVVGEVMAGSRKPVGDVIVSIRDSAGRVVAEARTDSDGQYAIHRVSPGTYSVVLDARSAGYRGQTVAASVGSEVLRIDWAVSKDADAIAAVSPQILGASQALASVLSDILGYGPMADELFVGGTVVASVTSVTLGSLAAAGQFNPTVSSSSL